MLLLLLALLCATSIVTVLSLLADLYRARAVSDREALNLGGEHRGHRSGLLRKKYLCRGEPEAWLECRRTAAKTLNRSYTGNLTGTLKTFKGNLREVFRK